MIIWLPVHSTLWCELVGEGRNHFRLYPKRQPERNGFVNEEESPAFILTCNNNFITYICFMWLLFAVFMVRKLKMCFDQKTQRPTRLGGTKFLSPHG
jgi:hypothetical protein